MKTKEQIQQYNKEYFSRPEVIARAKVRNAQRREQRKLYKKTPKGRAMNNKYRRNRYAKDVKMGRDLMKRYGITKGQFEEMVVEQNGLCKICGIKPEKRLHIDHCHKTGIIRGLLCGSCNRALGLLKDNTEFLLKAINYLENVVPMHNSCKEDTATGEKN